MKICILSPNYYTSLKKFPRRIFAPRDFAISLVNGLVRKGHKVHFATTPDIKTKAFPIAGDSDLLFGKKLFMDKFLNRDRLTERDKLSSFFAKRFYFESDLIAKTIELANREKFDIVHTDYPSVHFFEQFSKVPVVYTLHDRLPRHDTLEHWLLSKFSRHKYISISRSQMKGDLRLNFVGTVLHGLNTKLYRFQDKPRGNYIAFIGRLVPNKGAHIAVKIADKLGITLHLATEAVYKENVYYKKEIAPFVKKGVARMVGFLDKRKEEFYQNAKALIFPIEWEEPFGLVMIEAMASGTPVIAYSRGSVPEVIADGETGFVVVPESSNLSDLSYLSNLSIKTRGIEGLVEAVKTIYNMPEGEYRQMRQNCRRHVEEKFTVEKMVEGYESVYRRILSKSPR